MSCEKCGFNFDDYLEKDQGIPRFMGLCWKCLEKEVDNLRWKGFIRMDEWVK